MPGELPIRSLVVRAALLDYAHRGKCAAIEVAANCRTVLVNGAAVLTKVDAGPIRTLSKHQFTIGVPLREQVGQAYSIALFVNGNAGIMTASSTCAARDRPCVTTPPGVEKVAFGAVH
jgi:hypothetical protein